MSLSARRVLLDHSSASAIAQAIQIGSWKVVPRREWLWPHEASFLLRGADGRIWIEADEESTLLSPDRSRVELEPFIRLVQRRVGEARLYPTSSALLAWIVAGQAFFTPEADGHHESCVGHRPRLRRLEGTCLKRAEYGAGSR